MRRSRIGTSISRTSSVEGPAMPRMIPIPFGGSGPDRANVRNPATITAPAGKITRPELTRPPTIASCGSWLRSLPEQLGDHSALVWADQPPPNRPAWRIRLLAYGCQCGCA